MITGFESDFAILLLALAVLFSAGVGWWTYRGNKRLPAPVKGVTIFLRAAAVFLLLFLLFNPVYEFEDSRDLKNEIVVVLDNSRSLTIEKGEWQGDEAMRELIDSLNLSDTTSTRYQVFGFDSDLFSTTPDSLPLDGSVTNMNRSLVSFNQQTSTPDAVVLVTDGIFNRGLDPTRAAERTGIPFFTVAVGDTSAVRDVMVRNVVYNSTAYTNSSGMIQAEILNDGFPDRSIEVQLLRNGQVEEIKTVQTTESRSIHTLDFEVEFEEEGTEQFRIQIPAIGDEWTTANNQYSFTIDVVDDQMRILHAAFEIHPDVSSLRNLLATDEAVILANRTWVGGSRFIGGALPEQADTLDLVILHGYPHPRMDESIRQQIAELASQTNILLLSLSGTELGAIESATDNLSPLRRTGQSPVGNILPSGNREQQEHPIFDIEGEQPDFGRAPELRGPLRNFTSASLALDLLMVSHRSELTGSPMLSVQQIGNNRVAQLNAWQWHLWQQSTSAEFRDYYKQLMNNLVKWTGTGVSENLLEFSPTRSSFDEGEPVTFRATVQTETGQPDQEARVNVTIDGDTIDSLDFLMRNIGSGRHSLESSALPAGSYNYEAVAQRGNTEIDRVTGSFSVNESVLEFMDTVRRDGLLQFISESTDGAFFTFGQIEELHNELRERGFDEFRTKTFTTSRRAHHSVWWFFVVILLVGVEWTLRKVYDMA